MGDEPKRTLVHERGRFSVTRDEEGRYEFQVEGGQPIENAEVEDLAEVVYKARLDVLKRGGTNGQDHSGEGPG